MMKVTGPELAPDIIDNIFRPILDWFSFLSFQIPNGKTKDITGLQKQYLLFSNLLRIENLVNFKIC